MTRKYRTVTTRGEDRAITITNRYGQKGISLPRLDETKTMRGYPGLAGTAKKIAALVPKTRWYVEPFAGTAKVFQELPTDRYSHAVLNDKSMFVYDWLYKEFAGPPDVFIHNEDFRDVIGTYTAQSGAFLLIDPPWYRSFYDKKYSCFDREKVVDYDNEVLELLEGCKCKFIITSRKDNPRMLKSKYNNKLIEGDYKIAGHTTKTLLTTNMKI